MAGTGLTTKEKWGAGLSAGAAALPLLFGGGGDDLSRALAKLQDTATKANQVGIDATTQGSDMFRAVIPYVKAMAGGDQAALNVATMPERKRVIDQYDTARRSIAQFTPRGGGQATAMSNLYGQEASDLSGLFANARQQGVSQATDIGHVLSSLGLSAEGMSAQTQAAIAQILQKQQEQKASGWAGFAQAIGEIIGTIFL